MNHAEQSGAVLDIAISRRNFVRGSLATVAAVALAGHVELGHALALSPSEDLKILNYALTLEHLEATAYATINASGLLTGTGMKYFQQFGAHEATHVTVLTATIKKLGGKPVAAQRKYNFPSFKNEKEVLTFFQMVEEVGASAYLGQVPLVQNKDILSAAIAIHNVEAQHAAVLSDLIGVSPSPVVGKPRSMAEVLELVGPLLKMGGPARIPRTGEDLSWQRLPPTAY